MCKKPFPRPVGQPGSGHLSQSGRFLFFSERPKGHDGFQIEPDAHGGVGGNFPRLFKTRDRPGPILGIHARRPEGLEKETVASLFGGLPERIAGLESVSGCPEHNAAVLLPCAGCGGDIGAAPNRIGTVERIADDHPHPRKGPLGHPTALGESEPGHEPVLEHIEVRGERQIRLIDIAERCRSSMRQERPAPV